MGSVDLNKLAIEVRKDIINMISSTGSGHPGGSLSCVEILLTLYFRVLKIDPNNPTWNGRDRLVLSKGHAAPALYSILARRGFFNLNELSSFRQFGSILQGHPDMKRTPGIDVSTGSLGQGLSVGVGMALAAKMKNSLYNTFVIIGDGEMQEGQIWEALMAISHYKLSNLIVILDYNKLQIDGNNNSVMSLGNIRAKLKAFGFKVLEVDGHDINALIETFSLKFTNKPHFIIANTIKGKGISFMENKYEWHGKPILENEKQMALTELNNSI
jgi:transketolase